MRLAIALTALAMGAACADGLGGSPPAPAPLIQAESGSAPSEDRIQAVRARSFALRCGAPGVVRCVSFDRPEDMRDLSWAAVGERQGRGPMGLIRSRGAEVPPERDCAVASSGCSLKFTIPSRSGSAASGSWFANFSDDFSVRFGEGETFYVQWRQRFSRDFLETWFRGNGWKQAIVGEGDRPGYAPDGKVVWSCTQLELVVQNTDMRGAPQMYPSCGAKDGQHENLPQVRDIAYRPEEWMTFQMRAKIGTWYRNDRTYHRDSEVELWVAAEGERSRRAVVARGYDLANTRPGAAYGKIWLLPYHTNKDPAQDHPVGYTWYDEVIVSRQPIPDP